MCRVQCVLAMVALYVGVSHSWDLAVSSGDQLIFYNNDGTEIERVFQSRHLGGLAFDVVQNRLLYVDKQNNNDTICGYNLSSKENECFIERSGRNILSITYDPVSEKLFFTDANEKSINWISLKRGSTNNINGNLLIKMDDRTPDDIAVDSCRGYIYWSIIEHMENIDMERARFDGSEREALYDKYRGLDVISLTIDPLTQSMTYFDTASGISFMNRADMNGKNEIHYCNMDQTKAKELTVSKDYFYFMTTTSGESYKSVWRFPKYGRGIKNAKEISKFYTDEFLGIAANYKIEDQIKGIQDCDSLSNLIPTITEAPGCTCEGCDVGKCSLNAEDDPVCECAGNHEGARCEADVSDTTATTHTSE